MAKARFERDCLREYAEIFRTVCVDAAHYIVGCLGMMAGLIALLATRSLFSPSPLVIVPQILALLLLVWARVTFGRRSFHIAANPTEGDLVTTGPYRFIRHPIYTAFCLFVGAGAAGSTRRDSSRAWPPPLQLPHPFGVASSA